MFLHTLVSSEIFSTDGDYSERAAVRQLLGARRARHGVAVSIGSRGYGNRSAPPVWVFGVRLEIAFLVVSFTTLKLVTALPLATGTFTAVVTRQHNTVPGPPNGGWCRSDPCWDDTGSGGQRRTDSEPPAIGVSSRSGHVDIVGPIRVPVLPRYSTVAVTSSDAHRDKVGHAFVRGRARVTTADAPVKPRPSIVTSYVARVEPVNGLPERGPRRANQSF